MADTRDTIRDAARDTGNAVERSLPHSSDTMNVIMLIVGAVAILLFSLYAFGAFSPSTNTTTTTTESQTTPPN